MVANNGPQIAHLGNRALLRVEGPDWRSFLHNLLTHDVENLPTGSLRFAALLTPQGKFLHDVFVLADETGALLDVQLSHRDALMGRLSRYRLRAKVAVEAVGGAVFAAWGASPGPGWAEDPRLAGLGWRRLLPDPTGETLAANAPGDAYDAHRLALGVPDPARDCTPDKTYPIEADFDLLNGIDFKKGCFIGQETTSRMHRRGTVKTRTAPIVFEGPAPAPGSEVLAGELRAGEVLSGREGRALALLRLDRIAGSELTVEGRPVRAEAPAWMAPALAAVGLPHEGALSPTRLRG